MPELRQMVCALSSIILATAARSGPENSRVISGPLLLLQ